MFKSLVTTIIINCVLMTMPLICNADSPADLVDDGNAAYFAGDYDKALSAYTEASVDAPESPYLYFNKGAVFYQKGDFSTASEAFEKAALKSKDPLLEAMSKFNLGNCTYRKAERQQDSDLNKFIDACIISILYYQEALQLAPDLTEAAENIEVVRLVMKNLLDEINKQKEEVKQQQEAMDLIAKEIKELIKKQKEALDRNRGLDTEQDSRGEYSKLRQQIQDLVQDQKDLQTRTEALAQNLPEPREQNAPPTESPAEKHLKNATKEQYAASRNLEQNNTSEAATHQEKALKELKEALSSLDKKKDKRTIEEIKELIKKQQEALDRNWEYGPEAEQGSKSDSPGQQYHIPELAQEQKDLQTRTEALAQNLPEPGGQNAPPAESPAEKHLKNAAKEQNAASGNLKQNNTSEAAINQKMALKELKEALSSLDKEKDKQTIEEIKELIKKQQEALDRASDMEAKQDSPKKSPGDKPAEQGRPKKGTGDKPGGEQGRPQKGTGDKLTKQGSPQNSKGPLPELGQSPGPGQKIQELVRDQKGLQIRTEALAQNMPDPGGKNNATVKNPVKRHLNNAAKEQNSASMNLEQNHRPEAATDQEKALQELKEALSSLYKRKDKQTAREEMKDLIKKQQGALDRTRDLEAEQVSKGDSPELRQQIQKHAQDQKDLQTQTEALAQNMPKSERQNTAESPAEKHLKNAARKQDEASRNLEQNNISGAAPNQEKAVKELKNALSSLDREKDGGDQKQEQQGGDQQEQQKYALSPHEPSQDMKDQKEERTSLSQLTEDPQDILDEEKANKNQGRIRGAGGYDKVDKDW